MAYVLRGDDCLVSSLVIVMSSDTVSSESDLTFVPSWLIESAWKSRPDVGEHIETGVKTLKAGEGSKTRTVSQFVRRENSINYQ
jgi:hypothetical protein